MVCVRTNILAGKNRLVIENTLNNNSTCNSNSGSTGKCWWVTPKKWNMLHWSAYTNNYDMVNYLPGCIIETGVAYFNTVTSTQPCGGRSKCVCALTCPAGTYQDQSGQTTCKSCTRGQYVTLKNVRNVLLLGKNEV